MKASTPFHPGTDLAPIPFERDLLDMARVMKDSGLDWHPHPGCFVWDPEVVIKAPSPFPERVYFILNLNRFIEILGSAGAVREKLIWLPTWHQAQSVLRNMGCNDEDISCMLQQGGSAGPHGDLLRLYEGIVSRLRKSAGELGPGDEDNVPVTTWAQVCGTLDGLTETSLDFESQIKPLLHELFVSRRLAVLATQMRGQPYTNLVAFVASVDLRKIIFATTRSTRKFGNISSDPRVSMLIDNRSGRPADFRNAIAVTATGKAREIVDPGEKDRARSVYLEKHPTLREFVHSPSCALLAVDVETLYIVQRFQQVLEVHLFP